MMIRRVRSLDRRYDRYDSEESGSRIDTALEHCTVNHIEYSFFLRPLVYAQLRNSVHLFPVVFSSGHAFSHTDDSLAKR